MRIFEDEKLLLTGRNLRFVISIIVCSVRLDFYAGAWLMHTPGLQVNMRSGIYGYELFNY